MYQTISLTLTLVTLAGATRAEAELSKEIRSAELRAHVFRLASGEFAGRRGPGGARAAKLIAERFRQMKLEPAFGDSYYQPIHNFLQETGPAGAKGGFIGRNVGAVLPGSDPKLKDEWILLSAHYDHLGVRGGKLYAGADDNASGVAMLLEVAEHFALSKQRPKRTIMFVSFDLEEAGLRGSRWFAHRPPRSLKKLKCFITADMLGRSMANVMDEYVFLMGSETSPRLQSLVKTTPPDKGLTIGLLGADIVGTRSDYGPFRDRKIPFLFFSTGQNPDYHTPRDLPERIDYIKLGKISRYIARLVRRLADEQEAPRWQPGPLPDIVEAKVLHTLLRRVLDNPKAYPLDKRKRGMVERVEKRLAAIVRRGRYAPGDRTYVVWSSRLLLLLVF